MPLPRRARSIKLCAVKRSTVGLLILLSTALACGDASGGPIGTGGTGGIQLEQQSAYLLSCTIDTLVLEIPIELSFELDRPYVAGSSADLGFSAAITFGEQAAVTLIGAGISKVDIISMQIETWVEGATPAMLETSLTSAPINDFDLAVDTDDNGVAGPHRIELETQTIATEASEGAEEVELGLGLDQVSLVLGDFEVPSGCLGPSLVGFSARFPVEPAD